MFSISHDDNCSSPNTHDPSSSQMHKNVHQNLSFEEHAYALAMVMMMTMMSKVQLCWFLNSVLLLSQLCPKNLSPNFSSLHCNVISFPTLHWVEMLLHCRLLCSGCVLHWAEQNLKSAQWLKVLMLKDGCTIWSFSTGLRCKHWLLGFHKHLCC